MVEEKVSEEAFIALAREYYIDFCNRFNIPICVERPFVSQFPVKIDDNFSYDNFREVDIKVFNFGKIKIEMDSPFMSDDFSVTFDWFEEQADD